MAAERKLKVFLCHSSGDKPRVRDLYKRLQADGFEPWLDEEDLLFGQKWQDEIPKAVPAADTILVCLSRDSIAKDGYVQKEIKYALDASDNKPEGTIFIIPLRLEDCTIPDRLKDWHVGNLYEERGYEKLLRALRARAGELGLTVSVSLPQSPPPLQFQPSSGPVELPPLPAAFQHLSGQLQPTLEPVELPSPLDVLQSVYARSQPTPEPPVTTSSFVLPPTFRNTIGMEFVLIPAGEFLMGSKNGFDNEKPVRRVQISEPFYLGKYPVTQEQWLKVMDYSPSHFKGDLNRPMESVSWNQVQEFLRKLMEQEKGKTYRLPTEAEWEYSCRAGSTGEYCFGNDEINLKEYAWYGEGEKGTTHPVGQLKPNVWGLYDMHGNVWEWVQDWYSEDYYKQRPPLELDPQGPQKGEARVLRGGSCWHDLRYACCAARLWHDPDFRSVTIGFRVVMLP